MEDKNNKKNKLLIIMFIAIIAVLFVGVIYEFVCIKQLEKKVSDLNSQASIEYVIDK